MGDPAALAVLGGRQPKPLVAADVDEADGVQPPVVAFALLENRDSRRIPRKGSVRHEPRARHPIVRRGDRFGLRSEIRRSSQLGHDSREWITMRHIRMLLPRASRRGRSSRDLAFSGVSLLGQRSDFWFAGGTSRRQHRDRHGAGPRAGGARLPGLMAGTRSSRGSHERGSAAVRGGRTPAAHQLEASSASSSGENSKENGKATSCSSVTSIPSSARRSMSRSQLSRGGRCCSGSRPQQLVDRVLNVTPANPVVVQELLARR